jgi:hypothetical protein
MGRTAWIISEETSISNETKPRIQIGAGIPRTDGFDLEDDAMVSAGNFIRMHGRWAGGVGPYRRDCAFWGAIVARRKGCPAARKGYPLFPPLL